MARIFALLALFTVSALARAEVPVAPLTFAPVPARSGPAVATDGLQSLVVWQDARDHVSTAIYGARVDADGTLLDPIGMRLFDGLAGRRSRTATAATASSTARCGSRSSTATRTSSRAARWLWRRSGAHA